MELYRLLMVENPLPGSVMVGVGSRLQSGDLDLVMYSFFDTGSSNLLVAAD